MNVIKALHHSWFEQSWKLSIERLCRGNSEISLRYTLIRQVDVKASAFYFSVYLRLIKTERK